MSEKKPGAIGRTFSYLVSPRMFMSSEDVKRYGGLSFRYHRELIGEIKRSLTVLKNAKGTSISVKSVEERLLVFYDTLYESGTNENDIPIIHSLHIKRSKILIGVSVAILLIAIGLFSIPNITFIPNFIISIATVLASFSVFFKALSFNYYAWLIEQRLLPEVFSFKSYLGKFIKRWPQKKLSENMLREIKAEYAKRDQELKNYLLRNPDKTLGDIGLDHLKERLGE